MPIPTPQANESDQAFLDRCIPFLIDDGKDPEQAQAICFRQLDKLQAYPKTERQKEMFWKTFDSRRWGFLRWAQGRFKSALNEQVKPVLQALKMSVSDARAVVQSITEEPIQKAFEDVYGKVGGAFAGSVFRGFKAEFNVMQTKREHESVFEQFMKEWIRVNGIIRVQGITENTRRHLRQALDKGIEDGLGIEEIARMISGSRRIAGIQRARVIARTEIISASNRGSLEGAKRTNLNLNKEWIATRDGRTRRLSDNDKFDHLSADGQIVGIDSPFTIQGLRGPEQIMFPGDPTGSPGNVIMCRCTLGYAKK